MHHHFRGPLQWQPRPWDKAQPLPTGLTQTTTFIKYRKSSWTSDSSVFCRLICLSLLHSLGIVQRECWHCDSVLTKISTLLCHIFFGKQLFQHLFSYQPARLKIEILRIYPILHRKLLRCSLNYCHLPDNSLEIHRI